LSKLSCAGWIPHDRGFVLGLRLINGSVANAQDDAAFRTKLDVAA
jgi:hypothetical protein